MGRKEKLDKRTSRKAMSSTPHQRRRKTLVESLFRPTMCQETAWPFSVLATTYPQNPADENGEKVTILPPRPSMARRVIVVLP